MADDEAAAATLDDTAHPCGSCGEAVPTRQEFCGQCGARQPAVADTAVAPGVPSDAAAVSTPGALEPEDLAAMVAQATALVGTDVAFRSFSRRDRELRAHPNPDTPPLHDYVLGRCTVADARGAWVLLVHSTGARGWAPINSVKPRRSRRAAADPTERLTAPPEATSMIDALERLYALHTAGGLTDDEFARAKKVLLDGAY
jgi:hypothetical protein